MAIFDEIPKMQALVTELSPYLEDDLGVLIDPDTGEELTDPAFYLSGNYVPDSTLPRVVLSFNGSSTGHITGMNTYQEDNPDYVEGGDEAEYLYYIDREYHTLYSLSFSIEDGATTEVLTGERKSANYIARKIRALLGRNSIRSNLNESMESGIDYVGEEVPQTDLDGVVLAGSATMLVNFTTLSVDTEEVDGVIETVSYTGGLYENEEDTEPFEVTGSVTYTYE